MLQNSLILCILLVHNGIILLQPADEWLDWKNLFSLNITSVMVQNLAKLTKKFLFLE
jgi:hypothetical protein